MGAKQRKTKLTGFSGCRSDRQLISFDFTSRSEERSHGGARGGGGSEGGERGGSAVRGEEVHSFLHGVDEGDGGHVASLVEKKIVVDRTSLSPSV